MLTPTIVGLASLMVAGAASAQNDAKKTIVTPAPESGIVGHLGVGMGLNNVTYVDGGGNDGGDVWFTTADASITVPFANVWTATLDGTVRYDDFQNEGDFDDDEDPESQYTLGLHVLYQLPNANTRVGMVFGYGDTESQDVPSDDEYNVFIYGVEAQHFLNDDLLVYGQVGLANKIRDGEEDNEGFNDGMFVRLGATYFLNKSSTINYDMELAGCKNYIDSSDPGTFFGATLSYQTQITESMPLYFNCFGRLDYISSNDEGDNLYEMQLGIGLKYYFGAGSQLEAARKAASIGVPRLPTRASAWTEYID